MPVDVGSTDVVLKALGFAGGGSVLVAVGALIRGLLTGNTAQEQSLRTGLAERVSTLEARIDLLEARLDRMTAERDSMRSQRDRARFQREQAWVRINGYEVASALPLSVWPADPLDPPAPGGTP